MRLPDAPPHTPRPVILDDELLTPLSSRLLQNAANGTGRAPLILAACPVHAADIAEWHRRRESLTHAGAEVVLIETEGRRQLAWSAIRTKLREMHLFSVMVEGGATVIDSLLAANAKQPGMIQAALITVAPTPIGEEGTGYTTALPLDGGEASGLRYCDALELTPDRVVALKS